MIVLKHTLVRRMCAFAIAAASTTAAAQRPSGEWSALERVVTDEMASRGIPGLVVVIADGSRTIFSRAYGLANASTGERLTVSHLMQVGSVTKTFTALLALELRARGQLDIDARIRATIPALSSRVGAMTVRQLLSQTSGMRDVPAGDGPDGENELLAYASSLGDSMVVLPPGEAFSYSNAAFAVAGAVAQETTRRPFADLMRERILAPLGMRRSTMRVQEALRSRHAVGHVGPPGKPGQLADSIDNDTRLWPAGYLWSSGEELGRVLVALVSRSPALSPGVVDSLLTPRVAVPGLPNETRYGLGAFTDRFRGEDSNWHPGSVTGFSALWRTIPGRHLGALVLVNREGIRLDRIVEAALAGAAMASGRPLGAETSAAAPARSGDVQTEEKLRALEGVYEARFPLELRWRAGRLWLTRFGSTLPVTALGGQRYSVQVPGSPAPDAFAIVPAHDGWPPYIQMFLWGFPRVRS